MTRYTEATAKALYAPSAYVETVLANVDRPVTEEGDAHGKDHGDDHSETADHSAPESKESH